MKSSVKILALAAMVVALGACGLELVPSYSPSAMKFNIEAVPAGDFTRVTDTAFEEGDAVSIFAYRGTWTPGDILASWIDNANFVKGANGFAPTQQHFWYDGSDPSLIVGLYPYSADYTSDGLFVAGGVEFCVQSDQSTHEGYTASDFMSAVLMGATPSSEKVTLSFSHLLSKLVVDVDNQTSAGVSGVYIDGVMGNLTYSLVENAEGQGGLGTIKAGRLATTTKGSTDTYALIIPPQKVSPKLVVTTDDDRQYTYTASELIEFGSGKVRHLTVTITDNSISTEFDAIVNDWVADENVEFTDQPGVDNGGNTNKMEVNPNWRAYLMPEFVDAANGDIYENEVCCVQSTDQNGFYIVRYSKTYWNQYVAPDIYAHAKLVAEDLVMELTTFNAENGTDYDMSAFTHYFIGPYEGYWLMPGGEWIVAMWGISLEGELTGLYAASEVLVVGDSSYSNWLGTWELNDGVATSTITLSSNVVGESFLMDGWNGVYGIPVVVLYESNVKAPVFYGQVVAENLEVGDDVLDYVYFLGLGSNGGIYASWPLAECRWLDGANNTAEIFSYIYGSNETGESYMVADRMGYLAEIGQSLYYATSEIHTLPLQMTRVTSSSQTQAKRPVGFGEQDDFRCLTPASTVPSKSVPLSGLFKAGECRFKMVQF